MPAKSEPASTRLWRVPRWTLEVWLWAAVAFSLFEDLGCRRSSYDSFCVTVQNDGGLLFNLFPTVVRLLFVPRIPALVAWASVPICALGCQWLMRRFLPDKIPLWQAGVLVAGAWLLDLAIFAFWLWTAAH